MEHDRASGTRGEAPPTSHSSVFSSRKERGTRKRPRSADPTRRRQLTLDTLDGTSFVLIEKHFVPLKARKKRRRPQSAVISQRKGSTGRKGTGKRAVGRRKLLNFRSAKGALRSTRRKRGKRSAKKPLPQKRHRKRPIAVPQAPTYPPLQDARVTRPASADVARRSGTKSRPKMQCVSLYTSLLAVSLPLPPLPFASRLVSVFALLFPLRVE